MKTILVDDEPLALDLLRSMLEPIEGLTIVAECTTGQEAVRQTKIHDADLLFLDIQMPEMNGFDVIKALQGDEFPLVIFSTAFSRYAVDAFQVHAVDYVLKPLEADRVVQAVENARIRHLNRGNVGFDKSKILDALTKISERVGADIKAQMPAASQETDSNASLVLKDNQSSESVLIASIDWVEAAGDYVCIHSNSHTHLIRSTMKEIEAKLDPKLFQRVHRSTIVNLSRITKVSLQKRGDALIQIGDEQLIRVSRNYSHIIKNLSHLD